jgi:hypothetical protein
VATSVPPPTMAKAIGSKSWAIMRGYNARGGPVAVGV